jgi:hypothetical protein
VQINKDVSNYFSKLAFLFHHLFSFTNTLSQDQGGEYEQRELWRERERERAIVQRRK